MSKNWSTIVTAGTIAIFALGSVAISLMSSNKSNLAPSADDPTMILVQETPRQGEYCKEVRSPGWTRASGDKDTLAHANLMWAYYDVARAAAVNEARACSCAAFFPPFDQAEKLMRAEVKGKNANEINTLALDITTKNEAALATANKLCRGHKE